MQNRKFMVALTAALLAGQALLVCAQSQTPMGGTAGNDELVKEIRLIRVFLESSNREATKRTVLLERYRLQRELVMSITDRLEAVRDELSTTENEITKVSARAGDLQANSSLTAASDPDRKPQIDLQVNDTQMTLQDLRGRQVRLMAQESRLASSLNAETAKLRTLDTALDALVADH